MAKSIRPDELKTASAFYDITNETRNKPGRYDKVFLCIQPGIGGPPFTEAGYLAEYGPGTLVVIYANLLVFIKDISISLLCSPKGVSKSWTCRFWNIFSLTRNHLFLSVPNVILPYLKLKMIMRKRYYTVLSFRNWIFNFYLLSMMKNSRLNKHLKNSAMSTTYILRRMSSENFHLSQWVCSVLFVQTLLIYVI